MGDLFGTLKRRSDVNAKRVVEACEAEISDYQVIASQARTSMLDFAVIIRRRTADLVAADEPLQAADLTYIETVGEQRGAQGVSAAGQRSALALHASLTLREISEAAGPDDLDDTMRMLDWLARHGAAAQAAHTRGYLRGQERFLSMVGRVRQLAAMLLRDDPMGPELARSLGMPETGHYLVTVIRPASPKGRMSKAYREEVVKALLELHRMPLAWWEPEEFVALVPYPLMPDVPASKALIANALAPNGGVDHGDAAERRLSDFTEAIGRPCSVGTALGRVGALSEAAVLARKVSRVAPVERAPVRPYSVADVFAELGAAQLPQVDEWLRELARRLSDGPDLVITLDAYYRHDMNRLNTSATLHIHPRTLDYRLRRVRELVGIDPGSTRGVRVLSTTVTRILAGAWDEGPG
ncbi:PucR family transcriptional regulator [Nonomuraea sp. NPDC002799]